MSRLQGVDREVRPGTGRVRVTELKHPDRINPTPVTKSCEDFETEAAADCYLSPEKLESLCGTPDLCHVTFLEVCVDTRSNTLGNFGSYLPKLVQLKLNDSAIVSVRDLGTSIPQLQVLWMSRCCLQDLDGISNFTSLQELFVAYNYLSDLSQVGMLESLKLLDLEGNDVDDLVQIQYLGLCSSLQRLTLEGNPVCSRPNPTSVQMDYSYRAAVRDLIPQLRYLDDVRVGEDALSCWSAVGEDWHIFRDSIRDRGASQATTDIEEVAGSSRPASRHSSPGLTSLWPLSPPGSRPHTGFRPSSATQPGVLSAGGPRSSSAISTTEAETSTLTHGAGRTLFCGNPVRAIRARREKLQMAPARSVFTQCDLSGVQDPRGTELNERADVFAELRAWRELHSWRLRAIEKERSPQVLTIRDGDDELVSDEEGFRGMKSDSSDEEHAGVGYRDALDPASPDSSFQSLSPDSTPSPSPPVSAAVWSGNRGTMSFRVRRLRPSRTANSEHLLNLRSVWNPETKTSNQDDSRQISRTNV